MPPTATQIGSGPAAGGLTVASRSGGRNRPPLRDGVLIAQPQQQAELFGVQVVQLRDVLAEQGEGLGERAAAGDDLRPPVADKVQGREVLIDPHRVQHAQHGRGGRELDPGSRPGDRGVHYRR